MSRRRLVFFSYGMGVDSTAILLRWLREPASRDFSLRDLVMLSAMTGDEWPLTGQMVTELVLPLLRAHRIRYIQVARSGPAQTDGVRILDDSRTPTRLYLEGAYTLGQEMLTAGTVPQCGGARRCSAKAKGWPLDQVIAQIAAGRPYQHVLGFEKGEARRAARDAAFNTAQRTGVYPLIDWGWDRQACLGYIRQILGVEFPKSACTYCPFALANTHGRARTLQRFATDPAAGVKALFMEHVAIALNPLQGLIAGARLFDLLAGASGHDQVLAHLEERLNASTWAVYEVRRALLPASNNPEKLGTSARRIRAVATGGRSMMHQTLAQIATDNGQAVDTSDLRHPRVWTQRRGPELPATEWFYALSPHTVPDKTGPGFAVAWAKATDPQYRSEIKTTIAFCIRGGLHRRLMDVLALTGDDLSDALREALGDWVAATLADPEMHAKAFAQLHSDEQILRERRELLAAAGRRSYRRTGVP